MVWYPCEIEPHLLQKALAAGARVQKRVAYDMPDGSQIRVSYGHEPLRKNGGLAWHAAVSVWQRNWTVRLATNGEVLLAINYVQHRVEVNLIEDNSHGSDPMVRHFWEEGV